MHDFGDAATRSTVSTLTSLDRLLARGHPWCLRRNLRQALDAHEKLRRDGVPNVATSSSTARADVPWIFEQDQATAAALNSEALKWPIFKFDALQIRHPDSSERISTRPDLQRPQSFENGSEWHSAPSTLLDCCGTVRLRVFAQFRDCRPCQIRERYDKDGRSVIDIYMTRPFIIDYKTLLWKSKNEIPVEEWNISDVAPSISIACDDPVDFLTLYNRIQRDAGAHRPDIYGFRNAYRHAYIPIYDVFIFKLHPEGHLSPLEAHPDRKKSEILKRTYPLKGIELSMGWTENPASFIQRQYASMHVISRNKQPVKSNSSDPSMPPAKKIPVFWQYCDGLDSANIRLDGLICLLCQTGLEHTSFERLHLHFLTHHDHFKVIEATKTFRADGSTKFCTITYSFDEEWRETPPAADDEIEWAAPERPFNIKEELRHRGAYLAPDVIPKKAVIGRTPLKRNLAPRSGPEIGRPHPHNVPDLPPAPVKTCVVPDVPHVDFYDAAMRKLQSGELVRHHDGKIDDGWLQQARNASAKKLGFSGAKLDFLNAFDRHLDNEHAFSNMFINEAVVRFTRLNLARLRTEWGAIFLQKINLLRDLDVLRPDVYEWCTTQVGDQNIGQSGQLHSHVAHERTPLGMQNTQGSPNSMQPKVRKEVHRRVCVPCQKVATGKRGTIACANPRCTSGPFHMACFGLATRPTAWLCPQCV